MTVWKSNSCMNLRLDVGMEWAWNVCNHTNQTKKVVDILIFGNSVRFPSNFQSVYIVFCAMISDKNVLLELKAVARYQQNSNRTQNSRKKHFQINLNPKKMEIIWKMWPLLLASDWYIHIFKSQLHGLSDCHTFRSYKYNVTKVIKFCWHTNSPVI